MFCSCGSLASNCLQRLVRAPQSDDCHVRMVQDEGDEQRLRREKRQEAVRRVIERESEGIRRRLRPDQDEVQPPIVNVQVTTSLPSSSNADPVPPPPPPPVASLLREVGGPSGLGLSSKEEPYGAISSGSRSVCSSETRRDCATQTEGPQGLTFDQMCGLEMITTTSKTPGALHIFPECHALRNVTGTNRRMICKYCIQSLRHKGRLS